MIEYRGHTIQIEYDDSPQNPRCWDHAGKMICWHSRYNLGDEHSFDSPEEFFRELACKIEPSLYDILPAIDNGETEGNSDTLIEKALDKAVVLELYLYDHGGITMSCSPFSCPWDSGQVGFIYLTPKEIKEEWGDLSKESYEKAKKYLEGEVEVYDLFLTGQVYGYVIGEDSCWGFYGEDDCIEEAKRAVDSIIADKTREHFKQLKTWIRNKVPLDYRIAL